MKVKFLTIEYSDFNNNEIILNQFIGHPNIKVIDIKYTSFGKDFGRGITAAVHYEFVDPNLNMEWDNIHQCWIRR